LRITSLFYHVFLSLWQGKNTNLPNEAEKIQISIAKRNRFAI